MTPLLRMVLLTAVATVIVHAAAIHRFTGSPDGAKPYSGVAIGPHGTLYGTTDAGGDAQGNGVIYALTPPSSPGAGWTESILWSPDEADGINSYATLVLDAGGALYGTLFGGGLGGNGSVFVLMPPTVPGGAWTPQILHRFKGVPDAGNPTSGVVLAPGGVLYGTTAEAGKRNAGAVYQIGLPSAPGGKATEAVLYSFTGGADGGNPFGPVVLGPGGVLYGTARFGGAAGAGCVFQLTPPAVAGGAWVESVLYSFSGSPDAYPIGGVVLGANGALYGTTFGIPQSSGNFGNVYELTPPAIAGGAWVYTNLHSFTDRRTDAADPVAVTLGMHGELYGSAFGGASTAFLLTPPAAGSAGWTEALLDQRGSTYAPVTLGAHGAIYGTSFDRGGQGLVFSVMPK